MLKDHIALSLNAALTVEKSLRLLSNAVPLLRFRLAGSNLLRFSSGCWTSSLSNVLQSVEDQINADRANRPCLLLVRLFYFTLHAQRIGTCSPAPVLHLALLRRSQWSLNCDYRVFSWNLPLSRTLLLQSASSSLTIHLWVVGRDNAAQCPPPLAPKNPSPPHRRCRELALPSSSQPPQLHILSKTKMRGNIGAIQPHSPEPDVSWGGGGRRRGTWTWSSASRCIRKVIMFLWSLVRSLNLLITDFGHAPNIQLCLFEGLS